MRLTTKGLLLIAIPAVFELALLSALVKAQVDAEQAERWAVHSEDVLRQTTRPRSGPARFSPLARRSARDDRDATTPVMLWMDIDRRIDHLAELVADNPSQVERAAQIRQAVQAYRQWSDRVQDLLRSGRRRTSSRVSRTGGHRCTRPLSRRGRRFPGGRARVDRARSTEADAAREQQRFWCVAARSVRCCSCTGRVAFYAWRARTPRAAVGQCRAPCQQRTACAAVPGRRDCPARLTLHETSRRLLEAERIQARFQRSGAPRRRTRAHQRDAAAADPGKRDVHL